MSKQAGNVTFVVLSFEGPDPYSRAGGLSSRVTELTRTLADMGHDTHLFFIGDPNLPGHSIEEGGKLHLHRWCQWISAYHPVGVYDGEDAKLADWERSLPAWVENEILAPNVAAGISTVVIAEEWHTAGVASSLGDIVRRRKWNESVNILWNANNTFSFNRIDWVQLRDSAVITTVSRYMKHEMWRYGVDARVIPNGIMNTWLEPVSPDHFSALSSLLYNRLALVKVARWDPDKRWNMAVDATARLKTLGVRPVLIARGGVESHKSEVFALAESKGLTIRSVDWTGQSAAALVEAMSAHMEADILDLRGYLSQEQRKALYRTAHVVLANSGIEPFGLVGLETMASGGVAFVGSTGEDYVTHGYNAISIQSSDPEEIVHNAVKLQLQAYRDRLWKLRLAARQTAELYTWVAVVTRVLLPFLQELGVEAGSEVEPVDFVYDDHNSDQPATDESVNRAMELLRATERVPVTA